MHSETETIAGSRTRAPSRIPAPRSRGPKHVALLACMALVAASAPGPDAPADLHTVLEASYPAADSVYRNPVREIRLRFSTPVQITLSTVVLVGTDGPPITAAALESVPATDQRELRAALLAPLPNGRYTVRWTTAGPDSHPLSGSYAFTVELPALPAPAAPREESARGDPPLISTFGSESAADARDPLGAFIRSLFLLSILGMLGTPVFRLAVIGPLARDPLLEATVLDASAHTRGLAAAAAGLAFASVPMRLWKQSADLFGASALGADSLGRIIASPWGAAWMLQAALAAVFVAGLVGVSPTDRRTRGWWIMLAAAVGSALVPGLSGHAAATADRLGPLALVNDALHVTAAGVWMGTLAVLLIVGLPAVLASRTGMRDAGLQAPARDPPATAREDAPEPPSAIPALARMVNAFSRVAMWAVGGLVVTGVLSAWIQLGSLGALRSAYGVTLLAKLALVGAAASVGLYNWRVVRPALARDGGPGRLRVSATSEAVLGLLIVFVTAILIATPLPVP